MSDLAEFLEFLRKRLAEDEDAATRAASAAGDAVWEGSDQSETVNGKRGGYIATGPWDSGLYEISTHLARHDPARVLREVEAKRRLIKGYETSVVAVRASAERAAQGDDSAINEGRYLIVRRDNLAWAVKLAALPYADDPAFKEEWRP